MTDLAEPNAPSGRRRALVVSSARTWLGTPYRHQASLKGVGCDCLGLLRGIWRELIGDEPEMLLPYSPFWAEAGLGEPLLEAAQRHLIARPSLDLEPGAVLIFRWREGMSAKHCGIATSETSFIHAHDGACVAEVMLAPFWRRRLVATFDFPEQVD